MAGRQSQAAARRCRLSTQDASFLYAERASAPLHVGAIAILEGKLGFDELAAHIEKRLHLLPRFRQRLRPAPLNLAHPIIEDAPDFRLENHLFRHELGPAVSEAEASAQMMRHYERRLDRGRPLWELHSFEGLEGVRTALLLKAHHALVDGVSGVELLKALFDSKREAGAPPERAGGWRPAPAASRLELIRAAMGERWRSTAGAALESGRELIRDPKAMAGRARGAVEAARIVADLARRRVVSAPWNLGPVGRRRALAWTRYPLAELRAIRDAFGGSINDLVLAVLTEGAARYLKHHGYPAAGRDFCVGCPVNVRRPEERSLAGNRLSMMFVRLSAEPMDVVERLGLVRKETERIKAAGLAQALDRLSPLGAAFPPALMRLAGRAGGFALEAASALMRLAGYQPRPGGFLPPAFGINFVASNVRGVPAPLYLLGHQCLDQIPLVPLAATLGYSAAALSYDQNLYLGMVAAENLMADVGLMKFFGDEAFAELKERARSGRGAGRNADPRGRDAGARRAGPRSR